MVFSDQWILVPQHLQRSISIDVIAENIANMNTTRRPRVRIDVNSIWSRFKAFSEYLVLLLEETG